MDHLQHKALSWLEKLEAKDDRVRRAISYVGRTWLTHLLTSFVRHLSEESTT